MRLSKENTQDMRLHPEVLERFHELLRWHMSAARRGKQPVTVRAEMRAADAADQAALLKGDCDIETREVHEKTCDSLRGGFMWSMPCDCMPTQQVNFVLRKPSQSSKEITMNSIFRGLYGNGLGGL